MGGGRGGPDMMGGAPFGGGGGFEHMHGGGPWEWAAYMTIPILLLALVGVALAVYVAWSMWRADRRSAGTEIGRAHV